MTLSDQDKVLFSSTLLHLLKKNEAPEKSNQSNVSGLRSDCRHKNLASDPVSRITIDRSALDLARAPQSIANIPSLANMTKLKCRRTARGHHDATVQETSRRLFTGVSNRQCGPYVIPAASGECGGSSASARCHVPAKQRLRCRRGTLCANPAKEDRHKLLSFASDAAPAAQIEQRLHSSDRPSDGPA